MAAALDDTRLGGGDAQQYGSTPDTRGETCGSCRSRKGTMHHGHAETRNANKYSRSILATPTSQEPGNCRRHPVPGARCKQRGMTGQMSSAFASAMGGHVMAQAGGWSVTKTAAHVVATVMTALLLASGKQALWQLVSRLLPALPSEPVEVGSRPLVRSALVSAPSLVPSVASGGPGLRGSLGASQPAPKAHRQRWLPRHSPLCAARWSRHGLREPLRRTPMHNNLAPVRARTQEQADESCRRGVGRLVVPN